MPRRTAQRKTQLGTYVPAQLHERLRDHSDRTGVPITRLIEDALTAYLEEWEAHPFPTPRARVVPDRTSRGNLGGRNAQPAGRAGGANG